MSWRRQQSRIARNGWHGLALVCVTLLSAQVSAQDWEQWNSQFRWRELGPTATGGRLVDIEVDQNDPFTIWAAAASGGLWKTTNNGTTWTCIFQNEGTTTIGDIVVDPRDTQVIWVGTGEANNQRSSYWGDGIYKTSDGGETWEHLGLKESHHIGRIVIDPQDSNTVYVAAVGHLYSANEERGLYKTNDGGKNWKKVLYVNEDVGVVDVVVNPQQPSIVYAASYERRRRAWDFDGAGPGSAIYRSVDGGDTWTKLTGGLPTGNLGRIGLAVYPGDPDMLYATVSNQNVVDSPATAGGGPGGRGGRGGPRRSPPRDESSDSSDEGDEADGMATPWGFTVAFQDGKATIASVESRGTAARLGIRRGDVLVKLADVDISTELQLAAVLEHLKEGDSVKVELQRDGQSRIVSLTVDQVQSRQVGGEIYFTDDGGQTWEKRNRQPVGGSPAYYYGQIRIDPQDKDRLYVLGVPLYSSADGGRTWNSSTARSVHVDHHALWIDPRNGKHLVLGNDGGYHVSYDRGTTWDHVFNLPLSQFYAIGVDMQRPYWVYGGLQDNGTYGGPSRSRNPSGIGRFEWHRVGGGDGFYAQIDPVEPHIVFAESQFGVIYRLDRRTGQRTSIRPPQSDPAGAADRYNWNSPILLSRHKRHTIYFGGNKLFKSYNRGDDWEVISPDLTTANPSRITGNVPYCTITTIAESPLDAKVLLVGTDDGNVQWTDDGGKSWRNLADRFPLRPSDWWCTRVELSHHDINTAFVSFSGYREDDFRPFVFVTRDRGETWNSLVGNLPAEGPVNVIKEDPTDKQLLYVGTDFGVHASLDAGATWLAIGTGLPRLAVHDLVVHPRDGDLVIGTHARGIYILDDIGPWQQAKRVADQAAVLFAPREAVAYLRTGTQSISGNRRVYTPNPTYGASIAYYLKEQVDADKIALEVLDQAGKLVRKLNVDREAGFHRVVWDLRGAQGSRFAPPLGAGTYQVRLTVGDQVQQQLLQVLSDPLRP